MVLSFAFSQFFYRLFLFLKRWYLEASLDYWAGFFERMRSFDRTLAVWINIRLWLQPLYGDYSIVGRILGPVFRTLRIVCGAFLYALFWAGAFLLWLAWLGAIPFILFRIFL